MQDLLLHLLQDHGAISEKVHQIVQDLPEYRQALHDYETVAGQVRTILGYPLYDAYVSAFLRLGCYEDSAFYALGLGLREELVKLLIGR